METPIVVTFFFALNLQNPIFHWALSTFLMLCKLLYWGLNSNDLLTKFYNEVSADSSLKDTVEAYWDDLRCDLFFLSEHKRGFYQSGHEFPDCIFKFTNFSDSFDELPDNYETLGGVGAHSRWPRAAILLYLRPHERWKHGFFWLGGTFVISVFYCPKSKILSH